MYIGRQIEGAQARRHFTQVDRVHHDHAMRTSLGQIVWGDHLVAGGGQEGAVLARIDVDDAIDVGGGAECAQ